jgi:hypothetical protein
MSLSDVIVGALTDLLRVLFSPVSGFIESNGPALVRLVAGTPHPDAVFGQPTNSPWPDLYTYYWDSVVPLALLLLGAMGGVVVMLEATGTLFSGYHRTRLKRRWVAGLFGVLSWWWLGAFGLRLTSALARVILPDLSQVTLFETLSFSALGVLGLVVAMTVDLAVFLLIALVYLLRELLLYLFVLLMPLLIVLWIPCVGPFGPVASFARRLAGYFVPFLFMTVPTAGLLRLADLLGHSEASALGSLGLWLVALVIPLLVALVPVVLVWQAGTVFRTGQRVSRHMSLSSARRRRETVAGTVPDRQTVRKRAGAATTLPGRARDRLARRGRAVAAPADDAGSRGDAETTDTDSATDADGDTTTDTATDTDHSDTTDPDNE